MGNIINYLREFGYQSFRERPFGELDSLVLAQLSYLKFDGMVSADFMEYRPQLQEVSRHPLRERMFADKRWEENNRALLEAAAASRRFGGMRLAFYVDEVDEAQEVQFSAITFFLENGMSYVAFRGTDESFIGWKEDFNMAFSKPVPSQIRSAAYIQSYAPWLTGTFLVGGHSKGGNMAVYAAAKLPFAISCRIHAIYNHDGPGFPTGVLSALEYDCVRGRMYKTLPEASVFGMLLYQRGPYRVVASSESGILQHDPFSWKIEQGELVYKENLGERQIELDEALNHWIESLSEEQRKKFIETLYQVVTASEAKNLSDFSENWKECLNKVWLAVKDLDGETRTIIWEIVRALIGALREEMYEEGQSWLKEKTAQFKNRVGLGKKVKRTSHSPEEDS